MAKRKQHLILIRRFIVFIKMKFILLKIDITTLSAFYVYVILIYRVHTY